MILNKLKFLFLLLICPICLAACQNTVRFSANTLSYYDESKLIVGKTFAIIPLDGQRNDLEFKKYAKLVEGRLKEQGFIPSNSNTAYYAVILRYSVDGGRTITYSLPQYGMMPGDTTYHSGSFNNDTYYTPPRYGVVGSRVETRVEYTRILLLDIFNKRTGQKVYQGVVKSAGGAGSFSAVADCMIKAAFQDFPGANGTVGSVGFPIDTCAE